MPKLKKGDIVKWGVPHALGHNDENRGIIMGKSMEGLSDDWFRIFCFNEGRETIHHTSYLWKVEDEGA